MKHLKFIVALLVAVILLFVLSVMYLVNSYCPEWINRLSIWSSKILTEYEW